MVDRLEVQNGDESDDKQPQSFRREIEIKGQRLEAKDFKYLGAVISNERSKYEILSRIDQTTAALSRLKIIMEGQEHLACF